MDSIDHGTARRPLPASLAAARAELAELEGIADAADAAYHGADDPDMPDEDYDDIIARRSLIAATFPELNAAPRPVGHPPAPGLRRVRHGAPMRSLENIYVLDEVEDFVARTRAERRGGVLFKAPKPGQDRRIDLPAIGPETITQASAAGLSGIVWAAGGVLVLDRAAMVAAAEKAGLFLWARD